MELCSQKVKASTYGRQHQCKEECMTRLCSNQDTHVQRCLHVGVDRLAKHMLLGQVKNPGHVGQPT